MKNKWYFAAGLVAAGIVGGVIGWLAVDGVKTETSLADNAKPQVELVKISNSSIQQAASAEKAKPRFVSYSTENYPDLTYAAETAVQTVVNIEVTQTVHVRSVDPFLEFFGIPQGYSRGGVVPHEVRAGGSGVIISPDGYIVTNHHVVENAKQLKVKLYDGRIFSAEVVGTDPTTEVALIKIDGSDLPALAFGDSDALRLGEWVLAIGSPFDLQSTITAGIVSAKARVLGAIPNQYRVESFIQTDAAVNPGNSGGALVNTRGELVGINTLIKSQTGTYMGYSFAIPSAIVKKVVMDLKEYGIVQRALLGIAYRDIDDSFVENFGEEYGIDETGGVYVAEVQPDGAAREAGIRKGDIITAVDGVELGKNANLTEMMSRYRPNDKVIISVKRDGKVKQFEVVLRNKAGKAELLPRDYVDVVEALGGRFVEIGDRTRKELRIDGGVRVAEVHDGGILARANVRRGFVITEINGVQIHSLKDMNRIESPVRYIEGIYPDGRLVNYSFVR